MGRGRVLKTRKRTFFALYFIKSAFIRVLFQECQVASHKFSAINTSPPGGSYSLGVSVTMTLSAKGNWADIYFQYIPISTPTPTKTPTPSPTRTLVPCQVTTSPSSLSLAKGGTGTVTASVSSGLGSATVSSMAFGAYE
jgi:hypothetical protein